MSTIARIAVESWVGQGRHVIQQESPAEADLKRLFNMLNGRGEDTLSLETDAHGSLLVGGGPDRFVAVCFEPDGSSYHAEHGAPEERKEHLQVGGQVGDYPSHYILDRDVALSVAIRYCGSRSMLESLSWVRDTEPEKNWSDYHEEERAYQSPEPMPLKRHGSS